MRCPSGPAAEAPAPNRGAFFGSPPPSPRRRRGQQGEGEGGAPSSPPPHFQHKGREGGEFIGTNKERRTRFLPPSLPSAINPAGLCIAMGTRCRLPRAEAAAAAAAGGAAIPSAGTEQPPRGLPGPQRGSSRR